MIEDYGAINNNPLKSSVSFGIRYFCSDAWYTYAVF